jgi:hypothetical protein
MLFVTQNKQLDNYNYKKGKLMFIVGITMLRLES